MGPLMDLTGPLYWASFGPVLAGSTNIAVMTVRGLGSSTLYSNLKKPRCFQINLWAASLADAVLLPSIRLKLIWCSCDHVIVGNGDAQGRKMNTKIRRMQR
jgi:hypothetical protein